MTTPNVPLRMAFSVEVPGTPEQVWDAIATANGISSWFLPTDVEEREGGAIVVHMGETDSPGTITGWDPPRRLEYSEPEWAALSGHDVGSVTPMVTEFLVEAQSGGTCVVRVVTSAFGTGADWEQEFFDEAKKHWLPFFDNLRRYLARFPGQRVTSMEVAADIKGHADTVWSAIRQALGAGAVGQPVDARGLTGQVERIGASPGPNELLLSLREESEMSLPQVVSRDEWLVARKELLAEEKAMTRARDALNTKRRELSMIKIEKDYIFEGPDGKAGLLDLFDGRRQLIVSHFMFSPDVRGAIPDFSA